MNTQTQPKPLRLWPGLVLLVLQELVRFGTPYVVPGDAGHIYGAMGGLALGALILLWWAFFSRAPRLERWGGIMLIIIALYATTLLVHPSLGPHWFVFYPLPLLCLAFVCWAVIGRGLADGPRRVAMVATILLACGGWTVVRSDGITGDHADIFAWRWAETPEQQFLVKAGEELATANTDSVAEETGAEWPGYRGPDRAGVIAGVRIETDWSVSPPTELWRRPIGPGWSSFAVRGNLFYTQEQHGDNEVVSCYNATTGGPVWRHSDTARFWEPHAGAGPRATPSLSGDRVYTFGATGILNALDANSGAVAWSRNVVTDTNKKVPEWGFSNSPLVVDGLVIVDTAVLVAYDLVSGEPRWTSTVGGEAYSSPQLLTIEGVAQVILMNGAGAVSVAPADGSLLWEHAWPGNSRIAQPAMTPDGDVLIGSGFMIGAGTRRIAVTHGPTGWSTEEKWTSEGLKPYFNDFVVHKGHVFGFDGRILACIDAADGKRKWKGGRYGHGQLVLLADQDLLLVLTEKGELALVEASADQFKERARLPAIKGKTWNHPVLVGDLLLVRNSQEMVAFRLSLADN